MSANNPVSPKVVASTAGAGIGSIVSTLVIWTIGVVFFGQRADANSVANAISAVPSPLSGVVLLLITLLGAGVPGFRVVDPLRVTPAQLETFRQPPAV